MTSPNRETEAQQAENQMEHSLHTREKASLTIRKGKTTSLAEIKNLSRLEHREPQRKATEKISNPEQAKKAIQEALSQELRVIQKNSGQEVPAAILNRDQEKIAIIKATVPEAQAQGILNQEAGTTTAGISNRALLKKAAQEKPQAEKANAVI